MSSSVEIFCSLISLLLTPITFQSFKLFLSESPTPLIPQTWSLRCKTSSRYCIHEVFINSSVVQQQLVANKINFKLCHNDKSKAFSLILRSVDEKIIKVRTRHFTIKKFRGPYYGGKRRYGS
ncbi:uncharacterized protein OCT59_018488 [Rhizophagus irregularis]|uniref:uncharacterized protein n=1 Tax=Rhizophagus irregularis TaxID=588596 RepID=UPI00331B41F3|nr:hypothetical protein OCT59_018488 [Rhizophagus irregularis]